MCFIHAIHLIKVYTPKRDDEHPCSLHMRVPPGTVNERGKGFVAKYSMHLQ